MADVTELTPGQVLADAEVAEFIKAMGLGIAEAQRALDENTVNQIPIFTQAQPGLNGRSLLDLGLSPAFYHFQSADMSVSLNISLRIQKNTGFDLGLSFGLTDATTKTSSNSDTKTETSSGTTSNTQHREAKLTVKVTTDGALKVGGTDFQLAGDNPLARIRNLGTQLRTTESTGVSRALVTSNVSAVNPTCAPPSDNVITSPNAVAFTNGIFTEAVIRVTKLPGGASEDYTLKTGTTVTVPKQADTAAHAKEVAAQVRAKGYSATAFAKGDVLETLHFDFDEATIDQDEPLRPGETRTNRQKLNSLARALVASRAKVQILGFTDRSGTEDYNRKLGNTRREAIIRELKALNVPEEQMLPPVASTGEERWKGEPGPEKNPDHRLGEIKLGDTVDKYVFIRGDATHGIEPDKVTPDTRAAPTGPDNGFVFAGGASENGNLSAIGRKIVIKGADFPISGAQLGAFGTHSPEAYAANLARDVNANQAVQVKAWATGNVCNLANAGDNFELLLVTSESREITLAGTSDVVVTSQFSKTQTIAKQEAATGNRTVAVGATLNARFSKQFDQTITGNSTISAKLVAIPAPPQFLDQIKTFLTPTPPA